MNVDPDLQRPQTPHDPPKWLYYAVFGSLFAFIFWLCWLVTEVVTSWLP